MIISINNIRAEGNSLIVRMQPAVGLSALTSFTSVEVGVTQDAYFEKFFRYSLDGISFGEWQTLTVQAITGISLTLLDILIVELRYDKIEPQTGTSVLSLTSVEIGATQQAPSALRYFDKTVFKKFFETNSVEVLSWHINVLDKLYQKGIVPSYIDRLNDSEESKDFLSFWGAISKFFAFYVIYAREFQKFYESESLLSEFLEERGLLIASDTTLLQMNKLMEKFHYEMARRGTIGIVDKVEDGKEIDGELLRLIWYSINDEFIFNLHKKEHFGWNLGNSSPLYRGLALNNNANKYAQSFSSYPIDPGATSSVTTDGGLSVLSLNGILGLTSYKLKVCSEMDYEFSFMIKKGVVPKLTVRMQAYDKDLTAVDLLSRETGTALNSFFTDIDLSKNDKYIQIRVFLYNSVRGVNSNDIVEAHNGVNLMMPHGVTWIAPFVEIEGGTSLLYDIRFTPLITPQSRGYLQVNNWITCWLKNNNNNMSVSSMRNYAERYLIPYNSHIEVIDLDRDIIID